MPVTESLVLFTTALSISAPTFSWLLLGILLRRLGLLSERFIAAVSSLAFRVGLPLMLFGGAVQADYTRLAEAMHVFAAALATLLTFCLSWWYSRWRGHPRALQGIFVQAAFRSNLAIIGIALCIAAYGERGTALAALPVALLTVLYNVLAVTVLDTTLGSQTSVRSILLGVARNPLIIGISAGIGLSLASVPLPGSVAVASRGLSVFFLPVLLLCIGGSMRWSNLEGAGSIAWEATGWRLLVAPWLAIGCALVLGVEAENLGVLFLLLSSPVATVSFIMVVAARGDGTLAANLVVMTTLFSLVTVTLGFFLLSLLGLVGQLA